MRWPAVQWISLMARCPPWVAFVFARHSQRDSIVCAASDNNCFGVVSWWNTTNLISSLQLLCLCRTRVPLNVISPFHILSINSIHCKIITFIHLLTAIAVDPWNAAESSSTKIFYYTPSIFFYSPPGTLINQYATSSTIPTTTISRITITRLTFGVHGFRFLMCLLGLHLFI